MTVPTGGRSAGDADAPRPDASRASAPGNDGLKHRTVGAVAWSLVETAGGQATSLLVFILLARLLAPDEFGVFALAGVFVTFLQLFMEQGFAAAIVHRKTLDPEHLDTAFVVAVVSGLVLAAICVVAAPLAGWFYDSPGLVPIVRGLALTLPINGFRTVPAALLSKRLHFKSLALRTLTANVAGGVVGIGMALAGYGVWSLVGYQIANVAAGVASLWHATDWRPRARFSMKHYRDLATFGVNIVGVNLLSFAFRRSDDLLIGYYLGAGPLGFYTVGARVIRVMVEVLTATVTKVAFPAFASIQDDRDRVRRSYRAAIRYAGAVSLPAFVGVAVLAPDVLRVLFGQRWEATAPVLQILALRGIRESVLRFNQSVFLGLGRPGWRLVMSLLNTVVSVAAVWIALAALHGGIVAVAAANVIGEYILVPVSLTLMSRVVGIGGRDVTAEVFAPAVGCVVMAGAILASNAVLASAPAVVRLAASACAGAAVYALVLQAMRPELLRDVRTLAADWAARRRRRADGHAANPGHA
jgi:PST family polysaccharide transporter